MEFLYNVLYYYAWLFAISMVFTIMFPIFDVISVKIGLQKFRREEYKQNHKYLKFLVLPLLSFIAWIQWFLVMVNKLITGKTVIVSLPMMFLTYKFKRRARNIVYNFILKNGMQLKRLEERKPVYAQGKYILTNGRQTEYNEVGYIVSKDVSALKYIVANFLWVWHDDDNSFDMTSGGFSYKVYIGKHWGWLPFAIRKYCRTRDNVSDESGIDPYNYICKKRGKYFDVGDIYEDEFVIISGILWNIRNGMYNANYFYEEIRPGGWNDVYFKCKFKIFKYDIHWHFGYMRNTIDPGHLGRSVIFIEDIDRIK